MKNGIYVYGVIKTNAPWDFGEIGIGDKSASWRTQVLTIVFKELAAVISNSPFVVYDSLAKEKTVKDLVIHQLVIEKVMEGFTIIPVKFGTMVETENDVIKFMEKGYFVLRNALRKMEGKIELDVVASWKMPQAAALLYRRSSLIKRRQGELAAKGDKTTLEDKIALGKLVEQALKQKGAGYSRLILQTLRKQAEDVCLHGLADNETIFNAAFLIKTANKEKFNKVLDKLDQRLEDTLNFRLVGPLPPYSFSTILFKRISPKEVEKAQKTLGLNGEVTDKLINHAYRQLAQAHHPDKNAGQGQLEFDLINSAYRVLKDFTKSGFFNVDIYHWEGGR